MLFNSFEFATFFLAFCVLFFSLPRPYKPFWVLFSSYLFYVGWRPSFLLLLIATTLVDYCSARFIDSSDDVLRRRIGLCFSLAINLGLLATYKYLDFLIANLLEVVGWASGTKIPFAPLNLVLPIGISFYTFQSVGYVLDVYYKRTAAEKSLLHYAIYVAFFPQLVAGPIERAQHMIAQYKELPPTNLKRIVTGIWLIGWGLFKKMCIADLVSPVVNGIYADPKAYGGSYTLLATIFFAIQIYCDFSGYSDIAIGCARIIGIDLMTNFRQPYFSTSMTDFWRRWHIALSTWFRDYLYVPLGGSRVSLWKAARNTMIVFVVSGFWHGANWTFLVWGAIHGTVLVTERFIHRSFGFAANLAASSPIWRYLGLATTVSLVTVSWVFFRARSMADAKYILTSWMHPGAVQYGTFKMLGLPSVELLVVFTHIFILLIVDGMISSKSRLLAYCVHHSWVGMVCAAALFYDIALFGVFGKIEFVYFQF